MIFLNSYQKFYNKQFATIHTRSLIKMEKILNRPITKCYNNDDVKVVAADLQLRHDLLKETISTNVNKVLKI